MQSTLNLGAAQVRPAGISLEEGVATLKCETKRLLQTKSETMSYLCEEPVTYGDVVLSMAGVLAFFVMVAVCGFLFGGEVM